MTFKWPTSMYRGGVIKKFSVNFSSLSSSWKIIFRRFKWNFFRSYVLYVWHCYALRQYGFSALRLMSLNVSNLPLAQTLWSMSARISCSEDQRKYLKIWNRYWWGTWTWLLNCWENSHGFFGPTWRDLQLFKQVGKSTHHLWIRAFCWYCNDLAFMGKPIPFLKFVTTIFMPQSWFDWGPNCNCLERDKEK